MSCNASINVTYGSCIQLKIEYKGENGDAESIADDDIFVFDSFPAELQGGVITKIDPTNGVAEYFLPSELAIALGIGSSNWMRIARRSPNGRISNSEIIRVDVS